MYFHIEIVQLLYLQLKGIVSRDLHGSTGLQRAPGLRDSVQQHVHERRSGLQVRGYAAESLIAQLPSQGKLTTSRREN
jgi:hypothetical protein